MKLIYLHSAILLFILALTGCTETGTVTQKVTVPAKDSVVVIPEGKTVEKNTPLEITPIVETPPAQKEPEVFPSQQEFVAETDPPKLEESASEPVPVVTPPVQLPAKTEMEETGSFTVQIGAFKTDAAAKKCVSLAEKKFKKSFVTVPPPAGTSFYLVRTAKTFTRRSEAEAVKAIISQEKEFKDAWVITLK